ncbi:NRPS [Paraconiothyrium brasiliense]|uniref:NRPS n=1 Tax=Paraconiothyrium brasiliense TaxID=300254 RepID=A0ABR3S1N3_9PLEO
MLQTPGSLPDLSVLNRHPRLLRGPEYLHHLVPRSSATDEPAIEFLENGVKRRRLTYGELHEASDRLAERIGAHLMRLENASNVVPVLLSQSPELYIALLAILKSGRAFCPIGLDSPLERVAFILKDISADILVTDSTLKGKLPSSSDTRALLVDSDDHEYFNGTANPETQHQRPSPLAYVLYTSGSTGLPKAVSVSHRAVTQSLLAHDRHIPPFTRFLQFAAPTFDVSIFEIFFSFYRGVTLVGCTRTHMLNDLPATISSLRADAAELTPTVVSNLLRGRKSVPGLRLLLTIGEMLTRDIVDEYGGTENQPSILWGMYGPTEAAIHCTLQPDFSCDSSLGNIGFPLDTVTAMIAAPVPPGEQVQGVSVMPRGEVGELIIGGPQVADEYLNRPELTSAAFIHDAELGYLYRTGDKARMCFDGTLECLGRITSGQVKLRGQRVELSEIEQTIIKVDNCYSAVVMVIADMLVAFCATKSYEVSSAVIQETCKQWLPSYMVPADVIFVDRMPQLPSGKVDRKALETTYLGNKPYASFSALQSNDASTDPFTSIFERFFGRAIADDEDLGHIGLDSLRSIRIASALRQQGLDVGSIEILTASNLHELRQLCKGKKLRDRSSPTHVIVDPSRLSNIAELQPYGNDINDVLPCTPLQEAMLTETTIKPSAYCNWIEVELSENLSFSRISELLGILVQHNEILRTGFCMTSTTSTSFVQLVWKNVIPSTVLEVSTFSKSYSLGSVQSLLRPFTVQIIATTEKPRLLFQIHHALYDGWSFDLLLRDLDELLAGRASITRPQFREVVEYYSQMSTSGSLNKSVAYWRSVLREYRPTPLPNFNGRTLPSTELSSLRGEYAVNMKCLFTAAKEHTIHPQVFYQAAISYVLSQYLGTSDIVLGIVTSGRTIPVTQVEEIIGPCIATLPFRADLTCPEIDVLLQRMQQANREMLEHCMLPLREIIKLCQLRSGERLFDILFIWQESLVSVENRKLALRTVDSEDNLEFKLTFEIEPRDENIAYRITYDPSTFPKKQVEHFASQVEQTVHYFLSNRGGELEDTNTVMDKDALSIANPKPELKTIRHGPAHCVEERAVETPRKDAVILGSLVDGSMKIRERLSYASLNARANQLAHALMALRAGNDQLVCVMLEKSIDLYVSILAALKTGCGYLPIVPDTPAERVNRIIADAGVTICISKPHFINHIHRDELVVLDPADPDLAEYPDQNFTTSYNGEHLAYAVFTSGSTGKPKGVLVTQDNLMHNLDYLATIYPYTENSRLLQSCSQAFDVSVFEIFFSWYVGICLCTATTDDLFYDLEAAIDGLGITHLSLTPTVAGLLEPEKVPNVKFLVTAGEAVTEGVKRKWAGKGLYQGYGPSETTNICTVKPHVTETDLINNIGPVFPNTSLVILKPGSDHIVPRGAVGELCFGGGQVFRGYLNRPDLNAERILEHPTYGRIYRSGDMGRLLWNDSILSMGRLDDQVKVRGQRVELGEINSLVLDLSFVHDCTTVLIEKDAIQSNSHHEVELSQRLVVFWVPEGRTPAEFCSLAPERYRTHTLETFESLSQQLPAYMMPTHIVPISRIPMTSQAKIDKRLLHNTFKVFENEHLESTALGSGSERDDKTLTAAEMTIAEALSQTLSLPRVAIKRSSSFFTLGLDSVSAIRLAKKLRDAGFDHLPISVILQNPTIERLSSMLSEESVVKSVTQDRPLGQECKSLALPRMNSSAGQCAQNFRVLIVFAVADTFNPIQVSRIRAELATTGGIIDRILPCTPLQEAMLSTGSSDDHGNGDASYSNVMVFAVNGSLERLKKCWEHIVYRHDILRTTFVSTDNAQHAFAQVILKDATVTWDEIDLSRDVRMYARNVLPDLLRSHRPPVRLAIQGHGPSAKLVFCCHHALYDGVAIATLLEEIQDSYLERELPVPILYETYLRHMVSSDFERVHRFWKEALANFEPTYFPNLSGRVLQPSRTTGLVHKHIQMPLSMFSQHCRKTSTSLLSLVQAAWAKLLHFVLADTDLCFGNVVSGRTLPEDGLDRLVAPCFNTLPVRLNFDFHQSNTTLCKKLHAVSLDALPFQLTPLRWIQSKIRQEQGRLFDTLVILQQPSAPLDSSIWSLDMEDGDMDLPIVCEVFQDSSTDTLTLNLHHQLDLCQREDAETLAAIFSHALQSLVRYPDVAAEDPIGFPDRLLSQSNINFRPFETSDGGLLHSAFERNAMERPDAIALDFHDLNGASTTLTFRVLNEKANQLAHALVDLGIKPEDVVPIHMPKSPEFYISILGVLKAGAAFSPIHPDLPEARKQFMVSELGPKAILSRENAIEWLQSTNLVVMNMTRNENFPIDNIFVEDLRPTNIAYCLYTSGSTGLPKAVSMEHRSPIQTVESSRSLIPWSHNSRLLQYAAISFDMCYYDCFLAWTFGFTLCAAGQDTMLNNLAGSINNLNVDLLDLTPSVASSLRRTEVPTVKWLYCIGEAMTVEVVKEWGRACVNSYGPTEAAFCTTISTTTPASKTSVIGRPFPTTSFALFTRRGDRPLPIFGVGELYIGGAQLARGYHGQSQLTEEKFVHKCGQRFYKSGDMVRMLGDGNFEFLGRTDDQVKIRGLRVELGEIDKTLRDSHEMIAAVTTQILKKKGGSKYQLVAFLVPHRSIDESEQSRLRLAAKQKVIDTLPSYMVPQFFLFVDKIPKSMAGKIDRKALTSIFRDMIELDAGSDEAEQDDPSYRWNECQAYIRDIFSKLSGTPHKDIRPWTSIYQLGLDSISAVQIAAALRNQGFQANATDVLKYMNCKDLATHLERSSKLEPGKLVQFDFDAFERKHRKEIARTCGILDEQIEAIRPCTPPQDGMLSQFVAKDGDIYFNYIRLNLDDNIDLQQLRNAWLTIVEKHRMLRTGFVYVKDGTVSFAMIHYVPDPASFPEFTCAEVTRTAEQWLHESGREAVKSLHHPPWRIRVSHVDGVNYLDLALLHAIFDAQSLQLVFNDVAAAYHSKIITTAPLEPVIQNNLHLSGSEDSLANEFWKQLGKVANPTSFPNLSPLKNDPAPPAVLLKKSKRTLEELDMGCRASNITLQAAGLASWAVLLSAYVGEPSVTFGVVLSGRTMEGAEDAVFPCITTVPFACQVPDDQATMLRSVLSLSAEIQRYQFTPLNKIQKLMGYTNQPLFDSIFAFQKLSSGSTSSELWTVVEEKATIEYPLSIELEPRNGELEIRLTFLPHIVPKEQASIILNQLDYLLERNVFPDSETRMPSFHPEVFSITPADTPTIPTEVSLLHEFVELTAAKSPTRVAFEFATSLREGAYESLKWTYAQLDGEGNRIANVLVSHGIRPGELVGVCFDKCPEASIAILGVLKAGCAFVALDPGAPCARKTFILKDSGAPVVLSMTAQSASFKENTQATVLNLDEIDWRSASVKKPGLERSIDPQDRSYCLYTSGTTGTPKGCELTHENAVQAMLAFRRLFCGHWYDDSRWLQFASFHFDVSVLEQYWSWSVGICVVSAPRDLIFEDLAASIRALQVTHIDLTPSLAQILHPDDVPTLCKGVFITGGESLKQEILDVWGPKSVIYNGYGPTEATIGVTMYPRVPANGKPSNIGPQFDNVGSYVLHPDSDVPVLRGGVGELCVSGKLVGKGYLNRPDLTEERFAYLRRFDERVYRTGDLVRILHDGTFDFLGRADGQVKLRGQRLEVGEINSVIKQCGITVADVATLVLKHPKQQKEQLVAFVVMDSGTRGDTKVVLEATGDLWKAKEACQERLPPYMVPTHFVPLTTMPLSANNKAEARKLKELYEALLVSDLQFLSSGTQKRDGKWTQQESRVRALLKEALNITDNGIDKDASFFELGMDSISVIGVSRSLKQAGFSKATASVILKNATIRKLTKTLTDTSLKLDHQGSVTAARQSITAVQHRYRRFVAETLFMDTRNIEALAPCTPLQQGMISRSLESGNGVYFNSFRFALSQGVDVNKLRDAWNLVFASTEILRTAFVNTDQGFVQAVLRNTEIPFLEDALHQDDLLEDYLAKKKEEWIRLTGRDFKRPIEVLVVGGSTGRVLVVHIFHALYDGSSIGFVFQAVWDAYNDRKIHIGPTFHSTLAYGPLLPTVDARHFWMKQLRDRSFRPLATSDGKPGEGQVVVTRKVQILPNLEATRRKLNVTAQAIAQACWVSVLHQHLRATVTIGIVVSGRSIDFEGADKVIGPLFNTIPYQYCAQQRETWAALVRQSHDFNVAAQSYQHTPLRDIMKWLKRGPDQPLFETLFVYKVAEEDGRWAKNELWQLQDDGAEADYPLAIEVEQNPSGVLILTLVAQSHVVNLAAANELLAEYEEAMRIAVDDPDAVLETFLSKHEGHTSGVLVSLKDDAAETLDGDFRWSNHANTIRHEIANLAGVETEEVNANTSIFELGLDSIDAIKLSARLKNYGIELPVSGVMRSLNIANMTQRISIGKEKDRIRPSDMIYQANKKRLETYLRRRGLTEGVERVLPPTPLQGAMVIEMIASEYTSYYNHDVLKLKPTVDLELLKEAWAEVATASPILRTSFVQVDDPSIDFSHAQVVHYHLHDFWRSRDLDHEPNFPALLDNIRGKAVGERSTQPLFHVHLIRSPRQAYLILSIAHALYDGWSLNLLHSDVHDAYAGKFHPRPTYEPALHEILTATGADAVAFWRDYLSNAKTAIFPYHGGLSLHTVHRKQQSSCVALEVVTSFAKKHKITLQTLGQVVHGVTVASYTKSLDVTFGSVLSGRDDESKINVLFPTMNTVAIRTILHGTWRTMLQYVQDNFSNIKQWQHFPLRKALSLAGVHASLLQSLFIYQKSMSENKGEPEKLYESIQGRSDVEYPVCVEMEVVGTGLVWRCAVKDEVFDEEGAQGLLDRLDGVLKTIIAVPDAPVIDFTSHGASICGLPAFTNEQADESVRSRFVKIQPEANFPTSPTTRIIQAVLSFVSQTPDEEITAGMTIFHMGLDSISAIKASSLLRKRGITLSVGEMLRAGTVEEMVRIVDKRAPVVEYKDECIDVIDEKLFSGIERAEFFARANVEQEDVERVLPATAGQIYMLSKWVKSNGAMFYPEFSYRIHGEMSFEVIKTAWKKVVARNAILRTFFIGTKDKRTPYTQAIMGNAEASVQDVSDITSKELSDRKAKAASRQPYAHLFISRAAPSRPWEVQLKIHHALYDGVSLPLLAQQLQDLCNNIDISTPPDMFPIIIAKTSDASSNEQRRTFWANYLKDVSQHHVPQPSAPPTSRIEIFKPNLLPSVIDLGLQAHKHGLTTHSLFLATYAKLYARITSTPASADVVVGLYLANRSLPIADLHEVPIPTVNLVPLRVSAPLTTDVFEVAAQIQYDLQEISAPANASAGLWEIAELTGVKVDTFVNFLKLPDGREGAEEGPIKITPVEQWTEGSSRVVEIGDSAVIPPEELVDRCVNGVYLHALDIEATIRNGALDVGVFAPENMMNLKAGERLIEDIRVELKSAGQVMI